MKNIINISLLLAFSLIISTGCQTIRGNSSSSGLTNAVRNQDARISELTFQLKQVAENNNQAIRKLNEMIRENAELKQQVAALENNVSSLGKAIEAERNNRSAETERLLKEVAQQTTAAINARTAALQQQQKTNTAGGPATKGSFYEYTVQPGATLGAIAKAYKVSVAEIKQANNLKSDIIRAGQKLYIPKK